MQISHNCELQIQRVDARRARLAKSVAGGGRDRQRQDEALRGILMSLGPTSDSKQESDTETRIMQWVTGAKQLTRRNFT